MLLKEYQNRIRKLCFKDLNRKLIQQVNNYICALYDSQWNPNDYDIAKNLPTTP